VAAPARNAVLSRLRFLRYLAVLAVAGCSVHDSHVSREAQSVLLGMSELDLQTCLGAPDQRSTIGSSKVLTYSSSSTRNGGLSLTLPLVGGFSFSGSGYCHVNVRLDNGRVSKVRFSGETDALAAPDAYCAPIVRSCVRHPEPYWSTPAGGMSEPVAR
jgi:hypothetical protein